MGKAPKQKRKKAQPSESKGDATPPNTASDSQPRSKSTSEEVLTDHLPPIGLVFTVIACSGFLFVFSFRDVFATGRIIGGPMDEALLTFTNSLEFFDGGKGWKSTQGGLSSIKPVTTDANNMGGLFIRKVGGAAGLALQIQKLMPLLVHPAEARWKMGHFRPLLWTAFLSNLFLATFYASYTSDLAAAGADMLPKIFMIILVVEAFVILFFLVTSRDIKRGPAVALKLGKTPTSVVSRIVARTVVLVTGFITLFAGRDLFFPGQILDFIPRDDIYLEWTAALIHSPPEGSPEAEEYGISAPLHRGDKFLSQLMAVHILILCLYKFASAFFIRYGSDGGGLTKARMIWKAQALGDALILLLFRLFTSAASSASVDIRWYVMAIAYETFILGLYGYF